MIARLNFLLAVSVSVVLAFYVVGRFVFLELILRTAPEFAPYFVAAFALSALMLTVRNLWRVCVLHDGKQRHRLGRLGACRHAVPGRHSHCNCGLAKARTVCLRLNPISNANPNRTAFKSTPG